VIPGHDEQAWHYRAESDPELRGLALEAISGTLGCFVVQTQVRAAMDRTVPVSPSLYRAARPAPYSAAPARTTDSTLAAAVVIAVRFDPPSIFFSGRTGQTGDFHERHIRYNEAFSTKCILTLILSTRAGAWRAFGGHRAALKPEGKYCNALAVC